MSHLRGPSAKAEVITLLAVLSLLLALSPALADTRQLDLCGAGDMKGTGDYGSAAGMAQWQWFTTTASFILGNVSYNESSTHGNTSAMTLRAMLQYSANATVLDTSNAVAYTDTAGVLRNFTFHGNVTLCNGCNYTMNFTSITGTGAFGIRGSSANPYAPGGMQRGDGLFAGGVDGCLWIWDSGASATDPTAYLGTNPVTTYNSTNTTIVFDMKGTHEYNTSCLAVYGNWSGDWGSKSQLCGVSNNTWYNLTVTGIPAGYYVWTAWVNSTNSTSAFNGTNRTLTIDNVTPQVSVSFPANGSFMNANTQNLSVYASDNFKVGNVTVYGNWTNYCLQQLANVSAPPCGGLSTGTYSSNGTWTLGPGQTYDNDTTTYGFGNAAGANLFVNWKIPVNASSVNIEILTESIGTYIYNTSVNLIGFKNDTLTTRIFSINSGVPFSSGHVLFVWNGTNWIEYASLFGGVGAASHIYEIRAYWNLNSPIIGSPTNNTNSTFNITGLPDATYQFYSIGCDFLNNCNATSNYTFTVDTISPNITGVNTTPVINSYLSNTQAIYFNATVTDTNLASVWLQLGNGTNYTATPGSGSAYYVYFGALAVGTYNATWWANDSAGNRANSTNQSFQVVVPFLGLCGGVSNTTALNFTFYDESGLNDLNLTLEWNGSISSFGIPISTNGSATAKHEVDLCILPADATVYATALFNYYNASYVTRQYYLYNASLTSAANKIYLYGLPIGSETNVTVTVTDSSGVPVGDVLIKFLRYYVPTNTYRTVAMAKTYSGNGIAANVHLLTNNVWYRIILEKDGVVLNTFEPVTITGNTLTLKTSAGGYGDYWTYYSTVYAHCSTSNSTLTVSCTLADTTGIGTSSRFTVVRSGALTNTTICDTTSAGVNGVAFVCNLGNTTNTDYWYTVRATVSGSEVTIASGSVSTPGSPQFGVYGLVLTALLVIGVASVGSFSPAAAIVLAVLGVIIASVTQLAIIPTGALVGLGVVAGFAVFKMRT